MVTTITESYCDNQNVLFFTSNTLHTPQRTCHTSLYISPRQIDINYQDAHVQKHPKHENIVRAAFFFDVSLKCRVTLGKEIFLTESETGIPKNDKTNSLLPFVFFNLKLFPFAANQSAYFPSRTKFSGPL